MPCGVLESMYDRRERASRHACAHAVLPFLNSLGVYARGLLDTNWPSTSPLMILHSQSRTKANSQARGRGEGRASLIRSLSFPCLVSASTNSITRHINARSSADELTVGWIRECPSPVSWEGSDWWLVLRGGRKQLREEAANYKLREPRR